MKAVLTGEEKHPALTDLLLTSSVCADAILQEAGERYAGKFFIGTHPGIVQTDLTRASNTFHWAVEGVKDVVLGQLATETEDEAGQTHALILSSPNAARQPASY